MNTHKHMYFITQQTVCIGIGVEEKITQDGTGKHEAYFE